MAINVFDMFRENVTKFKLPNFVPILAALGKRLWKETEEIVGEITLCLLPGALTAALEVGGGRATWNSL